MRPDAVMVVSNGCSPDPRVQKEAASLAAKGYSVRVLGWDRTARLPRVREDDGFTIECFARASSAGSGLRQMTRFVGFWAWATRSIIRLRPRLVHCHDLDTYLPAFVAARLLGVPLVFDAHEVYAEMQRGRLPAPLVSALSALDRWSARHAHGFITVGEATRDHYESLRADVSVVANWSVAVADDPSARHAVRRELGIPDHAFVVGHLGGLTRARDLGPLLGAVERDPELYALVAGAGDQAEELAARSASQPRLKFIGFTHEPARYYHAIDVLYYLFRDGFAYSRFSNANSLGLSFAYAKPLITGATGDTGRIAGAVIPELILEHHSSEDLLRILSAARTPERYQEFRRRLRHAAAAKYSWNVAAEELATVYSRLLNGHHSPHEATSR
jgi:glycosyltransferase involved in cell wall biosynthesis